MLPLSIQQISTLGLAAPRRRTGKPSTRSHPSTHGIKSSLTGAGKNERERKAGFQFSRWDESGSVTHLPSRACWEVSEWNLIARHRELSLGCRRRQSPICSLRTSNSINGAFEPPLRGVFFPYFLNSFLSQAVGASFLVLQ